MLKKLGMSLVQYSQKMPEMVCYFVDKETGAVTSHSILDPVLYEPTMSKDYDPVTLREI